MKYWATCCRWTVIQGLERVRSSRSTTLLASRFHDPVSQFSALCHFVLLTSKLILAMTESSARSELSLQNDLQIHPAIEVDAQVRHKNKNPSRLYILCMLVMTNGSQATANDSTYGNELSVTQFHSYRDHATDMYQLYL